MGAEGIDRREFIARTAAATAALSVPTAAGAAARATAAPRPIGLPTPAQIRRDFQTMVDFGARFTGSAAHENFIDWLEEELVAAGVVMLPRDHFGLTIWEESSHGLELLEGAGKGPVKVSSYYPRTQETGPAGVTGQLVYAGVAPVPALDVGLEGLSAALAAYPGQLSSWAQGLTGTLGALTPGSILLIDVPLPVPLTTGVFAPLATHLQWSGHSIVDWLTGDFKRTALVPGVFGVPLAPFKALGAAGVVFILDASFDAVDGGYMPFEAGFEEIPGLYVDRDTGSRLRSLAAGRPKARLRLEATRRKGTSPALMGYIPGAAGNDEALILDTHTDGEGFVEENGGVALVHLARHFGSLPPAQRLKRNLVFSLWPGHMASGMPQLEGILEAHPDIVRSAAAAITVEHLGCTEWIDTADRGYHPTGLPEFLPVFTTQGKVQEIARDATIAADLPRTALLRPTVQFGVGGAMQGAGVPQIGFLAGPAYLLNDNATSDMEKLDEKLAARQVAWVADLLRRFDATPFAALATGDPSLGRKSEGPRARFPQPPVLKFAARVRRVGVATMRTSGKVRGTVELNRIGPVRVKVALEHRRDGRAITTTLGSNVVRFDGPGSLQYSVDITPNGMKALRRSAKGRVVVTARFREGGATRVRTSRLKFG